MADRKVSGMNDIVAIVASDVVPVVRSGDPTNYKATMTEVAAFAGSNVSLAANSVLANPGTATAAGSSVLVGDSTGVLQFGGVMLDAVDNTLTGTAPTTYYLTAAPDATGISGYYTAARVQNTALTTTIAAALTGTSATTVANFITARGDPGALAYAPGKVPSLLYASIDAGTITLQVRVLARSLAGVETSFGTSTATTFTSTSVGTPVNIKWRKTGASALTPTDRLIFRILATRVSGSPATVNLTLSFDTSGLRPTTSTTITGVGVSNATYNDYNVADFGAVADLISLPDGIMANGSPALTSASAVSTFGGFKPWMEGKTIEVSGALGAAAAPLLTTVLSVVNTSTLTLSANATAATGTQFLQSATAPTPDIASIGNYVQTDTLTLQGGTFATAAQVQVQATKVRDGSLAIVNAGSLGTEGAVQLQGTTGTGTPVIFRAYVLPSGALDPASISAVLTPGLYLTNPSNLSAEPVVVVNGSNPLTGATVSMTMDVRSVVPVTAGSYTAGAVPDDPVETSAGSVSGATGATLRASWGTTGRTQIGTDNGATITAALTAAIAQKASARRVRVVFPAGNYGVFSGAFPFITAPIEVLGAGVDSTQLYVGEGYTGAHIIGPSALFGSSALSIDANTGPNTMVSQVVRGAALRDISIYGNRTATVKPIAVAIYDRVLGFGMRNVTISDIANSAIRTGITNTETSAYLGEFSWSNIRTRVCGAVGAPAVYFNSLGTSGPTNDGYIDDLEIVFPLDAGLVFAGHNNDSSDGTKFFTIDKLRIERQGGNPGSATGDLLAFGSFDSTDNVQNININSAFLISAQASASAVAFYGPTPRIAPQRISIGNLAILGGTSYGTGISVNAGSNITIGVRQLTARTAGIAIAATTAHERTGTVGSGSTTGNLVLDASAASPTDYYTGGAAIVTSTATGTGVISSGVLTVSGAVTTAGQFRVGSRIVMSGLTYGVTIGSLGTGTGGNGTYNLLRNGAALTTSLGSRAVTAIATQTRQGLGYNGTTKTLTIGTIQGSSATWDWAPVSGEAFTIQSLIPVGGVRIDDSGAGPAYTYSIGTNSSNVLRNYIYPVGTPGSAQTVDQPYSWTGANTFSNAIITGGTLDGLNLGTLTANGFVYATGTAALAQGTFGSGLTFAGGTLSASGGGSGTVTSIVAGTGLSGGTITTAGTLAVTAATTAALGGVIVGSGLAVSSGTLSATGTGTVTSVAQTFTGGLISAAGSPITGTGTIALTVAGTSGGIPYFNSGTSWATSAALTSNAVMLGGGAGATPKTAAGFTTDGTSILSLGVTGSSLGQLKMFGTTSGDVTIRPLTTAGTAVILTAPNTSGTLVSTATAPLTINSTTGALGFSGLTANTLIYASGTATIAGAVLPTNWAITSGTLVPSSTVTVGLGNDLTNTIPAGTYDLGPFIQGGTVLNSYAHVASGTITYTGAIGQPGTYTTITGMSAITSSSTTIDTIGTATAANVIAAGAHLWVIIGGTPPAGGDVFFTVKVP